MLSEFSPGLAGMKDVRSGLDALLVATRVSKALTDVSVYMCVVKGTVGRPVLTTIGGYIENILRQQCGSWSAVLARTEVCRRPHPDPMACPSFKTATVAGGGDVCTLPAHGAP